MNDANPHTGRPPPAPPPPGLGLADVYFTLFRHWRMIAIGAALSVVASTTVYFFLPPRYLSEAKLLVRFVLDKRPMAPNSSDSQVTSPDSRGENIMNSEVEILGSADLALQVATLMGPERILAKAGGGTNLYAAAGLIRRGITIELPRRSNIILVRASHPDPELVQPILKNLLDAYINKHIEIHRNSGFLDDFLRRQRDQLRLDLSQTEGELREIRTNRGILSIEGSKTLLMDQISKVSAELLSTDALLAEARAAAGESPSAGPTNDLGSATNWAIPAEKLEQFRVLRAELDSLRSKERDLANEYTAEHPALRRHRLLLAEKENQRQELETAFPRLSGLAASLPALEPAGGRGAGADPALTIPMLLAKIALLTNRFERAQRAAADLVDAEMRMTDLQRNQSLKEANYRYYQSSLDQVAVDEALGPGKVNNLKTVQEPTLPAKDFASLKKPLLAALFGPLVFGLALAFLLELFLDQSIKRPSELERKVAIPLFVSIPNQPDRATNGARHLSWGAVRKARPNSSPVVGSPDQPPDAEARTVLASMFGDGEKLRPYLDALRDRLMSYFDLHNLTHKPRLVAITSCHRHAGVTSIATGLAASLSETGAGKVLMVDMRPEGDVQQFVLGKPQFEFPDAMSNEKRADTRVKQSLAVGTEHELNGRLSKILPERFIDFVKDYDYIIFDLPELSQTSIAPRIGRFMDIVLLVAEAERTHADSLRRSAKILSDSGAKVGAVLNRTRQYVPQRLSQELT